MDSFQPNLSLVYRRDQDLVEWCGAQGIGVIAYGPLAFGLLTGVIDADTRFASDDWRSGNTDVPPVIRLYEALFAPDVLPGHLATVEALRPIAEGLGISLAQLALAWAVEQQGVTGAICGTTSSTRARENAAAGAVQLSPDDLERIDAAARA